MQACGPYLIRLVVVQSMVSRVNEASSTFYSISVVVERWNSCTDGSTCEVEGDATHGSGNWLFDYAQRGRAWWRSKFGGWRPSAATPARELNLDHGTMYATGLPSASN